MELWGLAQVKLMGTILMYVVYHGRINISEEFILIRLSYNEVGGHESITNTKDIPLTTN